MSRIWILIESGGECSLLKLGRPLLSSKKFVAFFYFSSYSTLSTVFFIFDHQKLSSVSGSTTLALTSAQPFPKSAVQYMCYLSYSIFMSSLISSSSPCSSVRAPNILVLFSHPLVKQPVLIRRSCLAYFFFAFNPVLWISIGLNSAPDPWNQTNADQKLDPGQTLRHKK
jgi:hypothetical protein